MAADVWRIIEVLLLGLWGILMWIGRQQIRRVDKLEQRSQTVEQSKLDRAEVKSELFAIREALERHNARTTERLDSIMDRLTFGNGR